MHHRRFRWCARNGWIGRFREPRFIGLEIRDTTFVPFDESGNEIRGEPIYIYPDELEAFRLVYLENMSQEDAAKMMNISRGTLWRLLESARKKIAQALVEVRPIAIIGVSRADERCLDERS